MVFSRVPFCYCGDGVFEDLDFYYGLGLKVEHFQVTYTLRYLIYLY